MDNPNEYNDDAYLSASNDAISGISGLWESGADLENIQNCIKDGLENAEPGARATVSITLEAGAGQSLDEVREATEITGRKDGS